MTFLSGVNNDLAVFLADFGEAQSWTPAAGGAATAFSGIFDNDYSTLSAVIQASGATPAIICRTADVSGIVRDDTVTVTSLLHGITATAYKLDVKQDSPGDLGPGLSRLVLKR